MNVQVILVNLASANNLLITTRANVTMDMKGRIANQVGSFFENKLSTLKFTSST